MLFINQALGQDAEQGDLWHVTYESVHPAHLMSYEQWNKEFMEAIKDKEMPNWGAFTEKGEYLYAANIGKTMDGKGKNDAAWESAYEANSKLPALWEKYAHTISTRREEVWRHQPALSYSPEGQPEDEDTYTRVYKFWIKPDKINEATEIMKGYVEAYKKAGVSPGFGTYSSVSGEDQYVWQIRAAFKDQSHWAESDKINGEKLGDSTEELWSKWTQIINKMEMFESWHRNDISNPADD